MEARAKLRFDHDDRRRIYEYVERRGVVDRRQVREALGLPRAAVRHHVAILRRDGLLAVDDDGMLQIAMSTEADEEHDADGLAVTIRPARHSDLGGIVGAIEEVVTDGAHVEAETVAHVVDHEEVLLRFNELESRMFFVATIDSDVVGWAHVRGAEIEKLSHTAELTVGVLPAYRSHGIGTKLLERAVDWARDRGVERIYQSLPATNETGIQFLKDNGWTVEAVRADHYRIDGTDVDEVMLAYAT